ncbi:MAG: sulfotransferase [Bacteroidales bacterium]|nr:sulfotransferase [Bacteroidales bacterium]
MIFYSVLFLSFLLLAMIIKALKSVFFDISESSVAVVNDMLADLDEDEKIRRIQKSTNHLVGSMLKTLLVFVLAFAAASVPIVIYCLIEDCSPGSLVFTSFYSILAISLGATVPFLIPSGKKNPSAYSPLSQLLHRMALNNYYIADRLFRQETKKITRKKLDRQEDFVIISGLARAGTTSLMNSLSEFDRFVSLSYANMPFLLYPNIWARFYKPKNTKLKERSHKDGIMIGLNSNEALEEYFFKVKANDAYIQDDQLSEYRLPEEDYLDYLDYQSIIKLDNRKTYLAKNNNFILRYRSVREYNENFIMVILFRDPLTHAASLMDKHRDYSKLQQEDPFVLEYMNWLGHHEFGNNHKPFVFEGSEKGTLEDIETLDYWLEIWINYYRNVLSIEHPNTLFIHYDAYCQNPAGTLRTILQKAGVEAEIPEQKTFVNSRKTSGKYTEKLFKTAEDIYRQLLAK